MIEEPQHLKDTKNAIGYYAVFAFVSCGVFLMFFGMIIPFYWNRLMKFADTVSMQPGKDGQPMPELRTGRQIMGTVIVVWFILAWTFFILCMKYGNAA